MPENSTGFTWPLRVYIEDTDAGGIVYYINYLKFMERARTELLRSLGYGKTAIFNDDGMFVVHSTSIDYLDSAFLDDELVVSAEPIKLGRAYILFKQQVSRQGKVLCRGEVKIACVNRQQRVPQAMPEAMYKKIKSLVVET